MIRSIANVAAIAAIEGNANVASQVASRGIRPSKITRFAGFEIGNTKLAAFATNAQI
jgi:hypothetical protein